MARKLTDKSSLDALRKEAKRWRKAILADDAEAVSRYASAVPDGAARPTLREVQHALSHDYGFANWASLKEEVEDRARGRAERLALFLEKSAHRYGMAPGARSWGGYERDGPARGAFAARLLERNPDMARENIHTAVAAGEVEAVRAFLREDPGLANGVGGPDGWTPLLRLAHTRLPTEAAGANGLEIARLLLDCGADVGAYWSDGHNHFTALTGIIGGGEAGQSAHPQAEPLARLLLERGADPLDGQALYNTSLGADDSFWLELLWNESERRGETERWLRPVREVGRPLDYLLAAAVPRQPKRAAWLLAHGARADAAHPRTKRPIVLHAATAGRQDLVDLLVRHGAERPQLRGAERFLAAAMQADLATLGRLADEHPDYLRDPAPMFAAIAEGRTDVAQALLDLGMSPDVGDVHGFRALHYTTHCGAAAIAELLIARGAEIDPVERRYNATPLGHANYQGKPEMVAVIAPYSRDICGLCRCGAVARLAALLAEDRSLASRASRGELPLFHLPNEDEDAVEIAELLLASGADASAKNAAGLAANEAARQRGLEQAAEILEAAARGT